MILALYGAGAMGREFRQIAVENGEWSQIVFIDDYAQTQQLYDCPVYRFQQFRQQFKPEETRFIISIGEPKFRLQAFEQMTRAGYEGGILIHPSAYISSHATVGNGCIILNNAVIQNGAACGDGCILNPGVELHHDSAVGDYCLIYTNSVIRSLTHVGDRVWIGSTATVSTSAVVPPDTVIGDGEVYSAE